MSVLISALPIDAVALTADQTVTPASPTKAVTLADVAAGVATAQDLYGVLDAATVPEIVGYQTALSRNHVRRLYEEEGNDLYKLVFLNADGTHTMYLYDYPVKYLDSAGKARDITLDIADGAVSSGGFQTAANAVTTTFAKDMSDGISLSAKNATLSLVPHARENRSSATLQASSVATARRVNSKTVAYTYDEKTSIEYSLTYTGFKEDIVVSAYTGQTEYDFTLYTNGLRLVEKDGSFSLVDADGVAQAFLGDIIIFTADERNNAFGRMTAQTVTECQEYVLTIHVDAAYLADPKTVYPIRIDPTVEINYDNNGNGAISDVTISSNAGSSATSGALYVGLRENYGISRILMKFPGLNLSSLGNYLTINSATVELRDILCESQELGISCYLFNGNVWDESTVNWANASPNSYTVFLSERAVSYANGLQQTPSHRYSFDITEAVQGWETGIYNPNKGIIFKAWNTLENGTAYANKTFASYNRASNKPSLSVTYTVTAAPFIEDGNYYINNKGSGDYLRAMSATSVTAHSGTLANLSNSICWNIRWLGNDEYIIRSATDNTKYLSATGLQTSTLALNTVSGTYIPQNCRWKISVASGGGCVVQNVGNERYLHSDGTSLFVAETLGTIGTEAYYQGVWRIMSTFYYGNGTVHPYQEVNINSHFEDMELYVGEKQMASFTPVLSNEVWCDPSDFRYIIQMDGKISENLGEITGVSRGFLTVYVSHKVTDRVFSFEVYVKNDYFDSANITELRDDFYDLLGAGYANFPLYNLLDVTDVLDELIRYDAIITNFSNVYRIPKEFVQTVMFRELWCYSLLDIEADSLVQEYYQWKEGEAGEPLIKHEDSSTGVAQIFAETAINALNHAAERGFALPVPSNPYTPYDSSDWQDIWEVWQNLHNDVNYNIQCCFLVILDCQYENQATIPYNDFFDYSSNQIKTILSRYNGTNEDALDYGNLCYEYYLIFEQHNS